MDEIIEIIRASKSKKDASKNLMDKFGFTEIQTEAILELMLYRLTWLEIVAFEKEYKELEKEIKRLSKELQTADTELEKAVKKLQNTGFLAKAPLEVIEKEKAKAEEARLLKEGILQRLTMLKSL